MPSTTRTHRGAACEGTPGHRRGAGRGRRRARRRGAAARPADRAPACDQRPPRPACAPTTSPRSPHRMRLSQVEVFEVASFYHHFEVVRENADGRDPPALTVRVCDGLACELAGARELLARAARRCSARMSASSPRPASAAANRRPRRGRAQHPLAPRDGRCGAGARSRPARFATSPRLCRPRRLQGRGRLRALRQCVSGERDVESVIAALEDSGLRGLGGAGFPAGRKWRIVREQPAPRLMAVNIDEGEPGTFKDRYYLERDPHRFLEGMLIAAWAVGIDAIYIYLRDEYHGCRAHARARAGALKADPPAAAAADRPAPRRRRLHLRRRVGDDRIDRRQARHAAPAPAVCRAGRAVRPADAGAQLRDAATGCATSSSGRRLVRRPRPPRPPGPALVLGLGPREEARRAPRAGRHHPAAS